MATRLSVNINKVATIRNARGGNIPDVIAFAKYCEKHGAQGITVHPRPDGRHIRYEDVYALKKVVTTEFNIEGYPDNDFIEMVLKVKPQQVTLVPDPPDVLTSNAGWDTIKNLNMLKDIISIFKSEGIRTSLFIETDEERIRFAQKTGTDRIELYTEAYARQFTIDKDSAVGPYIKAARIANEEGLGINAGHDLNLDNLRYFSDNIPGLIEVSIGHALISDALYLGIKETIKQYSNQLK